ncbi:MAG TPA: hypothetical protein VIQ81_03995 [Gammaproteobacteria bacterium]
MADINDLHRAIGQLEGKVDSILENQEKEHEARSSMDSRLRKAEMNGARNGMVSGGVMATALYFLKETFKGVVS